MEQVEYPIKKKNYYISYIKGFALINIVLIHLINWSNMPVPFWGRVAKEFIYSGIFLFVLTTGSVIVIAYQNRTELKKTFLRLIQRGAELLFIYYLYNIIKLFIFNFSTQPFYDQFISLNKLTLTNILTFRSFTVPITILITYSFILAFSPLLLYIHKRLKYPKIYIALITMGLIVINYMTTIPSINNPIINFLYSNDYAIPSIALWLVPFLIGFSLAQNGFEKQRKNMLITGSTLMLIIGFSLYLQNKSLFPSHHEFPLTPYFMSFGLLIMSLLLYAFSRLEKSLTYFVKKMLTIIRFLGDNTLKLYIYSWLVIDLTIWIFYPHVSFIWITTIIFFALYLKINKDKLSVEII